MNNEINLSINLPDGVIQGNFLNSLSNGLRFSSMPNKIISGRDAKNINEIVISKGLSDHLSKDELYIGKYLTFAGEIEEFQDISGKIIKEYNTTKLLVVGVTDEEKNYVYHSPDWSISFFRDKLGVSSFLLLPRGIVFEFHNEEEAKNAFDVIKNTTNEYKVSDPLEELRENIDSTLEYANTILLAFSILSTVISTLLLGTVMMLNIAESKDEIHLFRFLGFKKKDVNSLYTWHGVTQGLISFIVSSFTD